jgi:hypothetical protein
MILAICINDVGKPNEIPDTHWIKKGEVYEVTWVGVVQSGEINVHFVKPVLGAESVPYTGFDHRRFRFNKKNDSQEAEDAVSKMLKDLGL